MKIFGGSNNGQEGSCATPPATTQYSVDRSIVLLYISMEANIHNYYIYIATVISMEAILSTVLYV